jgi:hypothetical protein
MTCGTGNCPMRQKNMSAMVKANALKSRPSKVGMECVKKGSPMRKEGRVAGMRTAPARNIRY